MGRGVGRGVGKETLPLRVNRVNRVGGLAWARRPCPYGLTGFNRINRVGGLAAAEALAEALAELAHFGDGQEGGSQDEDQDAHAAGDQQLQQQRADACLA